MGIQQALFMVSAANIGTVLASADGAWSPLEDVQYASAPSSCGISFNPNGTVTFLANNIPGPPTNWNSPTSTGVGNSWWIRATITSLADGTTSGTFGSWLQLSSTRNFSISAPTPGTGSMVITYEFSTDSAGSNIVATHTGNSLAAFSNSGPIP